MNIIICEKYIPDNAMPGDVGVNGFVLTLYNGNGGEPYASVTGDSFVEGGTVSGYTLYTIRFPPNGIQNGPDGIVLSASGRLVQFLSYEGTFVAAGGPANTVGSIDIGVEEGGQRESVSRFNSPVTVGPTAISLGTVPSRRRRASPTTVRRSMVRAAGRLRRTRARPSCWLSRTR